jgi:hypothetical protein
VRGKWVLITAIAMIGVGYTAYPFVTVYQLRSAVRDGDAPTLANLVDWPSVREGIKEDICDLVLEEPGDVANKGGLPAFGASFVRGVAGSSVDREFTPERVAGMAQSDANSNDDTSISWAFFSGPARFTVDLSIVGQAEPVRAEMELAGLRWRVKRVWLPETLLKQNHWAI